MGRMDLPQSIVVTGASRGIGAATARRLARPGCHMLLIGRDAERLAETAAACRTAGATIHVAAVDVGDGAAMAAVLAEYDAAQPVDFLFANAGISTGGRGGSLEPADRAALVIRTNLEGVVNTVAPLAEAMARRRRGRIALVSSLQGLLPLPDAPAYSAAKAGVVSYGLALDSALRHRGVSVTVLCPGFVDTDMSARFKGAKPFMMSAERAAAIMVRAVLRDRHMASFPWPLVLGIRIGQWVPLALRPLVLGRFRFAVEPERSR
jgi:short-subunit dehydrogenase